MSLPRPLFLTDDRLGPAMAGPAIRAFELASRLACQQPTTLASLQPVGPMPEVPGLTVRQTAPADLVALARSHDLVVAGGMLLAQHPGVAKAAGAVVLDLYAPFLLEDAARLAGDGALGGLTHARHRAALDAQMREADFMLCASERQRDYWLGRLCALGRLGPGAQQGDPDARRLIDLVPFGHPGGPLPGRQTPSVLRDAGLGIGADDMVGLWGGGLWDWLDPLTPIRAMADIKAPHLKLVFLAGQSPNPTTPPPPMAQRAKALAAELGVLGQQVIFCERWIPYAERGAWLAEADFAVSAHPASLESRFAFRTRLLDAVWAGLPILATSGDALGERVAREGWGVAMAPGDVAGWASALRRFATDGDFAATCRAQLLASRDTLSWEAAAAPLLAYASAPWRQSRLPRLPDWLVAGPGATALTGLLVLKREGPAGLATRLRRRAARSRG